MRKSPSERLGDFLPLPGVVKLTLKSGETVMPRVLGLVP